MKADSDTIERYARRLLTPQHAIVELRALHVRNNGRRQGVVLGYYDQDHIAEFAKAAAKLSGQAVGIYFTLNPQNSALLARRSNRTDTAATDEATKDDDILSRQWLLIDCDPARPSGISATDTEKAAALATAERVRDYLREEHGWPDPIQADSGNGYHLLYRIDLPADDGGLVKRVLTVLAKQFDTAAVKIDQSVHNAARICKLPGTLTCKGDSTPDRPHRMSAIIGPDHDQIAVVSRAQLDELAGPAEEPAPKPEPSHRGNGAGYDGRLDVAKWLTHYGRGFKVKAEQGKVVYLLDECPFNPDHRSPDSCIIQFSSGATAGKCLHNSCAGNGWQQFKAKIGRPLGDHYDPPRPEYHRPAGPAPQPSDNGDGKHDAPQETFEVIGIGDLIAKYPSLRPPIIEGLLREGESANIIAAPKVGKSWTALDLAFAVGMGLLWLDFPTRQGKVLLLDNELHPETLAHRSRIVAEARSLDPEKLNTVVKAVSLRGKLADIYSLGNFIKSLEPQSYSFIILDSFYRALPNETDENNNSEITKVYNLIDHVAGHHRAAFTNIHHSTKGWQNQKMVTDIGAGAGSQSRAVDCHMVFRPHKVDGVFVLDAACRSWPPIAPRCLRWSFPLWSIAEDCDPTELKEAAKGKPTAAEKEKAKEAAEEARVLDALDALTKDGIPSQKQIRESAGLNSTQMATTVFRLKQRGIVMDAPTNVPAGKGGKGQRPVAGLVRC
jgi:hypothetical protein